MQKKEQLLKKSTSSCLRNKELICCDGVSFVTRTQLCLVSQIPVLPLGMRNFALFILLICTYSSAFSQDDKFPQTISAGLQFRPIFPVGFLNTADQSIQNNEFSITVSPKFSFSAGMTIRYGFHKRFAIETGLNFVQRNYNLTLFRDSLAGVTSTPGSPTYNSKTDFTIIGYEHPIKLLVFVRLAERVYMNAAAGLQLTFFPSDIFTSDREENSGDQYFKHSSLRLGFDGKPGNDGFIHGGAIANLGFEYRTKKSGSFYLGGTYHIPFANVYSSRIQYLEESGYQSAVQGIELNGSYLTFDISYIFQSKPIERKEKKKKKSKNKD